MRQRFLQDMPSYSCCTFSVGDFTQHKNTIDTLLDRAELRTTYSKEQKTAENTLKFTYVSQFEYLEYNGLKFTSVAAEGDAAVTEVMKIR